MRLHVWFVNSTKHWLTLKGDKGDKNKGYSFMQNHFIYHYFQALFRYTSSSRASRGRNFQREKKFKSYCKTTHVEVAITTHLFERGVHRWSKPGFGLGCFEWKRVAEGGRMKTCTRKETCWHVTWHDGKIDWQHMNLKVCLLSHEILLYSHLSRNPLDSIFKSYWLTARPLTLKLLSRRTCLRRECIAGQSLPTLEKPSKASHTRDTFVILNDCRLCRHITRTIYPRWRPSPQTSNQYCVKDCHPTWWVSIDRRH